MIVYGLEVKERTGSLGQQTPILPQTGIGNRQPQINDRPEKVYVAELLYLYALRAPQGGDERLFIHVEHSRGSEVMEPFWCHLCKLYGNIEKDVDQPQ